MNIKLKVWRQKNSKTEGSFINYDLKDASPDMSFLEMLDVLNENLIKNGDDPVAFDHDCREGICGACGVMINGLAHGGVERTTTCQLHMRHFKDGDEIVIEPFRARAFPVIKDLCVDRKSMDRVMKRGGFVSVNAGTAPEANSLPIGKDMAEASFDAAACIQCGACVATCKNASAMLFVGAKITHFALLPQGQVERKQRVQNMVAAMDNEKFGSCTNEAECSAVCPKGISFDVITTLNREYIKSFR